MKDKINRILCVHQGWELYGSDRVFIQSLKAFRSKWPHSMIIVHLPRRGILVDEAEKYADQIITGNMSVIRRNGFSFKSVTGLIRNIIFNYKLAKDSDLVYINTGVILSYNFLTLFSKKKYILHIHEIPYGLAEAYFYLLARMTMAKIIVNSKSTCNAIGAGHIVHNGIEDITDSSHQKQSRSLNLLLAGRINGWKGHELAVEALSLLGKADIHLTFVGSYFADQEQYLQSLKEKISKYELEKSIAFIGFVNDTQKYYHEADIVLVPSIKPEPFGLVAIEAMRAEKPVVAADHGGLQEIVTADTGILFEPNSAHELARAIGQYYNNRSLIREHGSNGRRRFLEMFQESHYMDNFISVVTDE